MNPSVDETDSTAAEKPARGRHRRILIAVAVIAVAGLVAGAYALGAALTRHSTQASPPQANSKYAKSLAFAQCLRRNGVTNFPDPQPNGAVMLYPGQVDVTGTTYKKAEAACKEYAPTGTRMDPPPNAAPGPGGQQPPQGQPDVTKYVQCMRQNGEPNFPSPDAQGQFSGVDITTPAFKAAQKACAKFLPVGGTNP